MKNNCDQLLDYFNGTLSDEEKKLFEAHLESCSDCREELQELEDLTSDLPYLSTPEEPPSGMKERVLQNIFESESEGESESETVAHHDDSKITEMNRFRTKRSPKWIAPALAAALFLSLAGNAYTYISNEGATTETEEVSSLLKAVQLAPSEGTTSKGAAALVSDNGKTNLVVQADDLEGVQDDQVYQVWLLEGEKPYRAGSFVPGENGKGAVSYEINYEGDHDWTAVAITLEPNAESKTPKGKVVMSSGL
ncbi:anti-sigma factor domain-containing protein [Guptibacillus algicola]|uniref:anti-sigma factor n=1 Tax=Guptibacillus algicola TaxID=225844 RepID=UPI001CD2EB6D|nr:anti-sigma factor [Alkalihalobacillus algicola]MCA0985901.1 anti-sigma factor [Alkalihalobacillus algicola]